MEIPSKDAFALGAFVAFYQYPVTSKFNMPWLSYAAQMVIIFWLAILVPNLNYFGSDIFRVIVVYSLPLVISAIFLGRPPWLIAIFRQLTILEYWGLLLILLFTNLDGWIEGPKSHLGLYALIPFVLAHVIFCQAVARSRLHE